MEKIITNTGGSATSLGSLLKETRQKAKKNNWLICSVLNKVNHLNERELYQFLDVPDGGIIQGYYKLVKEGIFIPETKIKRRKAVEDADIECDGIGGVLFMNEIVDRCDNNPVTQKTLNEYALVLADGQKRNTSEVKADLKIRQNSPNEIIDRLLLVYKHIHHCTVIGFCYGLVVYAFKSNGKIKVRAASNKTMRGWYNNVHFLV